VFDVGIQEILIILVIALIVVGPAKLPELGRTIGRSLREFRRASSEIKDQLNLGLDDDEPASYQGDWTQPAAPSGSEPAPPGADGSPSAGGSNGSRPEATPAAPGESDAAL
jgi:Tat protein translocase TatB subunit